MKVIRKPEPLEVIEWDGLVLTFEKMIHFKPEKYLLIFAGDFLYLYDVERKTEEEVELGDILAFTKDTVDVYSRNELDKIYEVIKE